MTRFNSSTVLWPILFGFFIIALSNPLISKDHEKCVMTFNNTLNLIRSRINSSLLVTKIRLSCDDFHQINSWQEADIMVTTARTSGKHVICITNNDVQPCKYVLSTFITESNPTLVLSSIFGLDSSNQEALKETIERLFVRPSKLLLKSR